MERLKGKTILIGKESGQGRLLIAISGTGKSGTIGYPGSVPTSVSRCKPAEGVAHAKITVDQNGDLLLTNMKAQNVTFVNGTEIMSKRVSLSNRVELGKDKYRISLQTVIETAKQMVAVTHLQTTQTSTKKFNITHLERVWDEFHDRGLEIKKRQKQQGVYASLPMFFTMGGGAITFVLSFIFGEQYKTEIQLLSGLLVVIGLFMLVFSFLSRKNDTSLEDLEKITEDFQDRYVCPNPECNKFLGQISYKLMKKQYSMHCPYCKSEYVEK